MRNKKEAVQENDTWQKIILHKSRAGVAKLLIIRATLGINYGHRAFFKSRTSFVGLEYLHVFPSLHVVCYSQIFMISLALKCRRRVQFGSRLQHAVQSQMSESRMKTNSLCIQHVIFLIIKASNVILKTFVGSEDSPPVF